MDLKLNEREIQMILDALHTKLQEVSNAKQIYKGNDKVLLMLNESIDGYIRLISKIQGRLM